MPAQTPISPFLDVRSFESEESPESEELLEAPASPRSPFLSVYEAADGVTSDPEAEEQAVFLSELYDSEMDEALFELAGEAAALQDDTRDRYAAERVLQHHFEPLAMEIEGILDAASQYWANRDPRSVAAGEVDSFFDECRPRRGLSPTFENFWGKFKNALKKVAKTGIDLAKKGVEAAGKLALGPLLAKLKPLIRPLLQKVLRFAIGRLPPKVQPYATQLAQRLGFLKELDEESMTDSAPTSGPTVSEIQHEFNAQVADLLFARDEVAQQAEIAQAVANSQAAVDESLEALDAARDEFVQQLRRLKQDEDPTPAIQNFIPAILPVLRLGIKVAGRKRVVDFLAGLLGKLIRKFVGPQNTPMLSQALVDAGLRLAQLETAAGDEAEAAGSAVAGAVEETVRRVAGLPDYVLDNRELLEAFALEAFEQAAAANLPAVLPEDAYRNRPELRESKSLRGVWLPISRGRRRRFKKFSRILKARITPQKAAAVETFAGEPLSDFLSEQLGCSPGDEVEAEVHLYESIPGAAFPMTTLGEAENGLGSAHSYVELHPLTPESAGTLLGEAGLGREVEPQYLLRPFNTAVGQRFYRLKVPGKRMLTTPGPDGTANPRRRSHAKLVLDFTKSEIRVHVYLSERRAQGLAAKLRQQAHIGAAVLSLRSLLHRALQNALIRGRGRLKVIHEAVLPNQWSAALRRLPASVPQALLQRVTEWTLTGLTEYFKKQASQVIAASEDPGDGMTLTISLANPPGMSQLRQALSGKPSSPADLKLDGAEPNATVNVAPGHQHE